MTKATVCLSIHFDAVSTWLWSYDSWNMPTRHSRGVYGADVGAPRMLELFDQYKVPSTWCIPGHTIESFPEICEEVYAQGHGVQHHGWTHKGPSTYESKDTEKRDIERGIESIRDLTGVKPSGYASPAWDFSEHTLDILQELDFKWDSSVMAADFQPHYLYGGWAAPEDGPYQRGEPTDIVELPVSWERDDFPPFTYTWSRPHRMGYVPEDIIFQKWYDQFDWMYDNIENGVFVLTLHPQVIGQSHRLMRLEAFIQHVQSRPGTRFEKMDTVATEFRNAAPQKTD